MSMLRSDAELALDEVTEICKAVADHYRSVRAAAHTPELAAVFVSLEEQRRRYVAVLEEETRRLGNLPGAPDRDREALEHLVVRLRAAFAEDERIPLLASCEKMEDHLAHALRQALGQPIPENLRRLLRQLEQSVSEARRSLAAARD